MENLAVGILRKAFETCSPQSPLEKMLVALIREQV